MTEICKACGESFEKSQLNVKYCPECRAKYNTRAGLYFIVCDNCGKRVHKYRNGRDGNRNHRFCGMECFKEYKKSHPEEYKNGGRKTKKRITIIGVPPLDKMSAEDLLHYGKISVQKQIASMYK